MQQITIEEVLKDRRVIDEIAFHVRTLNNSSVQPEYAETYIKTHLWQQLKRYDRNKSSVFTFVSNQIRYAKLELRRADIAGVNTRRVLKANSNQDALVEISDKLTHNTDARIDLESKLTKEQQQMLKLLLANHDHIEIRKIMNLKYVVYFMMLKELQIIINNYLNDS